MSLYVFLAALALVGLAIGFSIWPRPKLSKAKDRPDLGYHVYTDEFDTICRGSEVDALLDAAGVNRSASRDAAGASHSDRIDTATQARSDSVKQLRVTHRTDLSDTAVLLLLDQSGSMATRMPRVSAQIAAALERLEEFGARTSLVGFTTVGWHGGQSRRKWLAKGSKKYPGRLCDLLHIVHSDFADPTATMDLSPLNQPNVLFENVDGETLLWARERLLAEAANNHILIIVSDGAPVDDSTLSENGLGFLWSHIKEVVVAIESDSRLSLGAIGLDYRVDELYSNARFVEEGEDAASLLLDLVISLAKVGNI